MSALRSGTSGLAVADAIVLPRWLRRPARALGRLTSGEIEPPRFAALIASVALIASASLYGMVLGGHGSTVAQAISARSGFAIEDIKVTGNRQTSELDVFDRIGLSGWTALIGFDADEARDRIAGLPWIEQVAVRKVYPSTLEVEIVEREAFAVWQRGSRLVVVDADGAEIVATSGRRHASLPLVIGQGAAEAGVEFLSRMRNHGDLAARVVSYIPVADRRWDLRLDNGVTIRLPDEGVAAALTEVMRLHRANGLLSRDISLVDMRFADRIVLRMNPEAREAREAELKRSATAARSGRRI